MIPALTWLEDATVLSRHCNPAESGRCVRSPGNKLLGLIG